MKSKHLFLAAATTIMTSAASFASSYLEGSYGVDPMHSKVGFEIPHLVISTVEGKFTGIDGKIDLKKDFTKSSVEANIDIKTIDTGVEKRDDHLRSVDFFDVSKHSKMTFKSTSIKGTPEGFQLSGDLTIKGIKKSVTFDGKFLGNVKDGFGNQKAAFVAKTKINRKDFGLTWNSAVEAGPVVGDEVTIDLRIQAVLDAKK